MPKQGDLRVWWIPQVPMKAFQVPVKNLEEAKLLLNVLAGYDYFQYRNRVKPDYSNAGGLIVYEDGEWLEWYDECDDDISAIMGRDGSPDWLREIFSK